MNPLSGATMNIGNNMLNNSARDVNKPISITPGESIGEIKLGMSRQDLYRQIGKECPSSSIEVEYLEEIGLKIEYENDKVVFLEADATWRLYIDNFDIFNHSFGECQDLVRRLDPQATIADDTVDSKSLGIGFWTNQSRDDPPYLLQVFPKT